ncbi:hypothetical protein F4815DRAFT_503119 [Daldinia loculata]|uniref:uncharacterized protein n=1 Tax=Daldinia loculata TaxID=103429 RepID=UPI0020C1DD06|nr:uncharacterized protein F4817DRAFT_315533 [Daldinia loculata]KAI1647666.1 hypothetical protein F4817DRAFT_315533 [Daldinia loculata]KAI2776666.1 hypothetical protein F4815DRAFT_503119 [Daldinia loculata]
MSTPPHLKLSVPFWERLQANTKDDLTRGSASLYFRAYGQADRVLLPSQWREVGWTIQDFAYFYDSPEYESARSEYIDQCLMRYPLAAFPTWQEVVDGMQVLFTRPDAIVDYMFIRPKIWINKEIWRPLDYAVAFILRLLNHREHIHSDVVDGGEFVDGNEYWMEWQKAYAQFLGSVQPFYQPWDSSDKWTAAFLLYLKLQYEHEIHVRGLLDGDPKVFAIAYVEGKEGIEVDPKAKERYTQIEAMDKYHS